ncbi:MAG: UDP-N-acetylmuramoyl-tripeptide--D-alanyl-D-alanine ligase [Pseudomonadota bacterium]|nr:UDP-N-acetylmuramoyl-tripeptide--D-alanyl-D-alanine ligase [Pseudomonadota bacterium]
MLQKISWHDYRSVLGGAAVLPTHLPAPQAADYCFDSRTISKGQWFVALRGEHYDGHHYIAAALAKGAQGYLAAKTFRTQLSPNLHSHGIWVDDQPLLQLAKIANLHRRRLSAKIIAITGSTGKTTCKELLAAVLRSHSSHVSHSFSNENNEIGVIKALLRTPDNCCYCVLEFGARHGGDIATLTAIAAPDIALCTNIGSSHLGIFSSPEQLLATKCEIYTHSPADCICIVNKGYPALLAAAHDTGKRLITFGTEATNNVRIVACNPQTVSISLQTERGLETYRGPSYHAALADNLAAVVAICVALDVPSTTIQAGLATFSNLNGRFQTHKVGNLTLIDDSYNASPQSMAAGLSTLRILYPNAKKILILGDMLELGDTSIAAHQELQPAVAALKPALVITVGRLAAHIASNAFPHQTFADVQALLTANLDYASIGDVIYVKGSNAIGLNKVCSQLLAPGVV